jgi:predicted RNase H-like nuclease
MYQLPAGVRRIMKFHELMVAAKLVPTSPSTERPGKLSSALVSAFSKAGYPLLTEQIELPGLIEVYPHPALIELTAVNERLPYKAGKIRNYWPDLSPIDRRMRLISTWSFIVRNLETDLANVAEVLPRVDTQSSGRDLKSFEDMLDAIICAWIGIRAISGKARPYGDGEAAIWVPDP